MADWKTIVRARVSELRLTESAESELTEELAQHLEDLQRELQLGGASDEDAYREVLSELDDIHALRAGVDPSKAMPRRQPAPAGDTRSRGVVGDVLPDLRYAARSLRANPLFALIVIVTLGLGIGVNTTVFTLINAVIVSPLPVTAPDEVVAIAAVASAAGAQTSTLLPLSHLNFTDYQAQNRVFAGLAGYTTKRPLAWETQGDPNLS
jgi:hypothetical protein